MWPFSGRKLDHSVASRNAMKYTPAHGKILVRLAADGPDVTLEIADNGPGIDADRREDIFLPFYTTKPDGTGVGLSFARQIVVAEPAGAARVSPREAHLVAPRARGVALGALGVLDAPERAMRAREQEPVLLHLRVAQERLLEQRSTLGDSPGLEVDLRRGVQEPHVGIDRMCERGVHVEGGLLEAAERLQRERAQRPRALQLGSGRGARLDVLERFGRATRLDARLRARQSHEAGTRPGCDRLIELGEPPLETELA